MQHSTTSSNLGARPRHLLRVVGAVLAVGMFGQAAFAQAPVLLYQNDFETVKGRTPAQADAACIAWGTPGTAETSNFAVNYDNTGTGTLASTVVFKQVGTADRICWNRTPTSTTALIDPTAPTNKGGKYAGGFARNANTVETWSIELTPGGQPYINGRMDLAHVIPGNLGNPGAPANSNYYNGKGTAQFTLQTFKVAAGAVYTFEFPTATGIRPGTVPVAAPPNRLMIGAVAQTPISTALVSVVENPGKPREALWQPYSFSADTSTFSATDRLVVVATMSNGRYGLQTAPAGWTDNDIAKYVVFDNLEFTAAAAPVTTPPVISKAFSVPSVVAGGTADLTITVANPSGLSASALSVTDVIPAPLQLVAGSVTTTCTPVVAPATPASSLSDSNNTIALSGYGLPIAGCTISAQVQWPTSAAAQCLLAAPANGAVNTIASGTQFSTAAGQNPANATATLSCHMADLALTLPSAPTTATRGNTLSYAFQLQNLSANLPASASTVQLTLPAGTSVNAALSDTRCNSSGLCSFGNLAANASEPFTVVLDVPTSLDPAATTLPLSAVAATATTETTATNNSVSTQAALQKFTITVNAQVIGEAAAVSQLNDPIVYALSCQWQPAGTPGHQSAGALPLVQGQLAAPAAFNLPATQSCVATLIGTPAAPTDYTLTASVAPTVTDPATGNQNIVIHLALISNRDGGPRGATPVPGLATGALLALSGFIGLVAIRRKKLRNR